MFTIRTYNKISPKGLDLLPADLYHVSDAAEAPDAILLRSQSLHDVELPPSVKAVARAGAGVNNIPVERCAERGIVVFNTPGANANSVKELVLAGLFLSSRGIVEGVTWARSLADRGDEVPALVEQGKKQFKGPEILGKTLGVVGLGAIGVAVANAAVALGMHVVGHDPFITVASAWGLSSDVRRASSLDALLAESDYVTLHAPLTDDTRDLIDARALGRMRRGARLLNFARGGLVDNAAVLRALDAGTLARYVTDFPDAALAGHAHVLPVPHLGASTPEAEDNCAVMAARQLRDFLEHGNITNSVNFPTCQMPEPAGRQRIVIANRNVPNMVGQITTVLARHGINIADLLNQSARHYDLAYNIIDVDSAFGSEVLDELRAIDGVITVRGLQGTAVPA
ncbi:MAG: phosphoglycerate dehydrogenase [Rhodothermales bacterium]|nr:phosphoglycerate dehydrogenase [Rhodothermales bacterium]